MRRPPLILVDGEIREATGNLLAAVFVGFPSVTVGGKVTASDTNVHAFSELVAPGVGDEELVAPVRLQVTSGVTANITILRIKDNGDPPLISDTDHFLCVLTGGGFMIADECNKLDKIYFHFSTAVGSPSFVWSAGYGEE